MTTGLRPNPFLQTKTQPQQKPTTKGCAKPIATAQRLADQSLITSPPKDSNSTKTQL